MRPVRGLEYTYETELLSLPRLGFDALADTIVGDRFTSYDRQEDADRLLRSIECLGKDKLLPTALQFLSANKAAIGRQYVLFSPDFLNKLDAMERGDREARFKVQRELAHLPLAAIESLSRELCDDIFLGMRQSMQVRCLLDAFPIHYSQSEFIMAIAGLSPDIGEVYDSPLNHQAITSLYFYLSDSRLVSLADVHRSDFARLCIALGGNGFKALSILLRDVGIRLNGISIRTCTDQLIERSTAGLLSVALLIRVIEQLLAES